MRIAQFSIRGMLQALPTMISLTFFCGLCSCKTETKVKNEEAEMTEEGYVLISEVPNASGKNLMKTFVISK